MSLTAIAEWVLAVGLLVGIGVVWVTSVVSAGRRGRLHVKAWRRAPRARRAAMAAAVEDPIFAPERIQAGVATILELTEAMWQGRPARALSDRRDAAVITSWAENSRAIVGPDARITGRTRVDILGVINREDESEDRVVVRIRVHVNRGPRSAPSERRGVIDERWTLVHHGVEWYLAAAAGDPLAPSLLSSPLIASPGEDDARLREASLEELTERRAPHGPGPGELTDVTAPAMSQLRDLSLADDRFAPILIETAIGHIVEGWERSSDGSDAPLLAVATGAGADALNFPRSGHGRRRVRDAELRGWEVTRVDAAATPPRVEVRVRIQAASWTDAEAHAGDDRDRRRLDLLWTLELDEITHAHPRWRLINSTTVP